MIKTRPKVVWIRVIFLWWKNEVVKNLKFDANKSSWPKLRDELISFSCNHEVYVSQN